MQALHTPSVKFSKATQSPFNLVIGLLLLLIHEDNTTAVTGVHGYLLLGVLSVNTAVVFVGAVACGGGRSKAALPCRTSYDWVALFMRLQLEESSISWGGVVLFQASAEGLAFNSPAAVTMLLKLAHCN
jgi:hypothetical protein